MLIYLTYNCYIYIYVADSLNYFLQIKFLMVSDDKVIKIGILTCETIMLPVCVIGYTSNFVTGGYNIGLHFITIEL